MSKIPFVFGTIRARLTLLYSGFLAITLVVTGGYFLVAVRDAAQVALDNELRSRFSALRASIPSPGNFEGKDAILEVIEQGSASGPSGAWIQLSNSQGTLLYQSREMKTMNIASPPVAALPARGYLETKFHGERGARVLTAPLGDHVIQIAMPVRVFQEMFLKLLWILPIGALVLFVVACAGGYWLSGRALKPVDEIGRTVQKISSSSLTDRLVLRGTGDEIDRLSNTMNQMLERLESSFRMVTQLSADASHELRTPVAIIRITSEVVRSAPRSSEEHEAAWDKVIIQTERMSSLIDDLLLLARADAGHSDFDHIEVDVAESVRSAVEELAVVAEAAGLSLMNSVPESWMIRGDEASLRRLFVILLDNAIKYNSPGGSISVSLEPSNDGTVRIQVKDTGIGISPDDLPRIFDRFYRVASDRSRTTGGSGLGLSIARWIVSFHGGRITAESCLGAGSTFSIVLPSQGQTSPRHIF